MISYTLLFYRYCSTSDEMFSDEKFISLPISSFLVRAKQQILEVQVNCIYFAGQKIVFYGI